MKKSFSLKILLVIVALVSVALVVALPVKARIRIDEQFEYGFCNLVEDELFYISVGGDRNTRVQIPCRFGKFDNTTNTAIVKLAGLDRFRVSKTVVYDCSIENDGWCIWYFDDERDPDE